MKKLLAILITALVIAAVVFAFRHKESPSVDKDPGSELTDNVVKPVPVSIDVDNLADGIYPVAFSGDDVENTPEGCRINFEIFNRDLYDVVELHQMKVGDYIEIDGFLVKIDSLSVDGDIVINGGLDNGGVELIPVGGGVYRYRGWNDVATYTSYGKVAMTVPDSLTFIDKGNVSESMEGVIVPGTELYEYLKSTDFGSFSQYCVILEIHEGKVTGLRRNYMP